MPGSPSLRHWTDACLALSGLWLSSLALWSGRDNSPHSAREAGEANKGL